MVMYNNNDTAVDSIVRRKTALGLWRSHPDNPDDEMMRLYHAAHLQHPNQFVNLGCGGHCPHHGVRDC